MDRVQIAAIALAAILVMISVIYAPDQDSGVAPPPPAAPTAAPGTPLTPAPGGQALEPQERLFAAGDDAAVVASPERVISFETRTIGNDALELEVSNAGGRVIGAKIPGYRDRVGRDAGPVELVTAPDRGTGLVFLGEGALAGAESAAWEITSASERTVEMRLERQGVEIVRRLEVDEIGYGANLRITLRNASPVAVSTRLQLSLRGQERSSKAPDHFQTYGLVALHGDQDLDRWGLAGIGSPGFLSGIFGRSGIEDATYLAPVHWVGIDSQYFMFAAIPIEDADKSIAVMHPLGSDLGEVSLIREAFVLPPNIQIQRSFRLFIGPKTQEDLAAVDPRLEPSRDVGWLWIRPLVNLFAYLLKWTHDNVIGNYGVAIILLTILLRLAVFPLTQRSMKSMKRLSAIAPQMKELQEKYADNKEKMQAELMSLYKTKGMNPLSALGGGCIPMIIQMPFMIGLYFALRSSIELRHADFILWFNDLSAPENFFDIAGLPIRLLPLLMGGSMLLQQKLTPQSNPDPQQQQMMMWMSVMFTFLFYQFPSGLVLYWFVSNLLGIAQQLWVNRQPVAEEEAA